jgi:hypothetical protein
MYTVAPYYMAKTFIEIPLMLLTPILYEIVVYFGMGLTVTAG